LLVYIGVAKQFAVNAELPLLRHLAVEALDSDRVADLAKESCTSSESIWSMKRRAAFGFFAPLIMATPTVATAAC
jgi:hypothetical protein